MSMAYLIYLCRYIKNALQCHYCTSLVLNLHSYKIDWEMAVKETRNKIGIISHFSYPFIDSKFASFIYFAIFLISLIQNQQ